MREERRRSRRRTETSAERRAAAEGSPVRKWDSGIVCKMD
jgi:hypothetical protein